MKKVLIFVSAFLLIVAPAAVFADTFTGSIVPDSAKDGPYLQACNLVELFDNALRFAIYLAVIVATIMFAYAGFLYVTAAASPTNLDNAKKVFGNVFLGLIIVLSAWLVVNLIMNVLFNDKLTSTPWNRIPCVAKTYTNRTYDTGAVDSSLPGDPDAVGLEDAKRDQLYAYNVKVNNSNACPVGVTSGCTTIAGMDQNTIDYVGSVKQNVDPDNANPDSVVVTGGSELGHSGGTRPGSHGAGDKVDLRVTPEVKSYVDTQVKSGSFTKVEKPSFGSAQYVDTKTGAVWTYEKGKPGENDHYDICVTNCAAPAAQGS